MLNIIQLLLINIYFFVILAGANKIVQDSKLLLLNYNYHYHLMLIHVTLRNDALRGVTLLLLPLFASCPDLNSTSLRGNNAEAANKKNVIFQFSLPP